MARFLADENVPADAARAARINGLDFAWVRGLAPGAADEDVAALAHSGGRVLVTSDKDFGEIAFRLGRGGAVAIASLRPRLRSPDHLARFLVGVLSSPIDWEGNFCVAREGRMRVVPIPP